MTDKGASSAAGVFSAAQTPDGRYVVFTTESADLTPRDTNGGFRALDVFVRDRRLGRTTLVSVNRHGTDTGAGSSSDPVITPDGRYVAFVSSAPDLIGPEFGSFVAGNVYLRDLTAGKTILVSQTLSGKRGGPASGGSVGNVPPLSVSDNGRYVLFASRAEDLVANDSNQQQDIFVRDVQEGRTTLVSVNSAGTASGNFDSSYAVMTPDGRYVAFRSTARNLVANDNNPNFARDHIFLRDLQSGTTKLVSANHIDGRSGNDEADYRSQGDLAISADGRYVAFVSSASDLTPGDNNGGSISDSGQDVFVRDTVSGTTELVSVDKSGTASGAGNSGSLMMTPDGRFVVFVSSANDLVPNDTNKVQDVFLRDLQSDTTATMTVSLGGVAGGMVNLICEGNPGPQFLFSRFQRPSLSADGRYVAFVSSASDLTAASDNNCVPSPTFHQDGYDVFVRDTVAGSTRLVSTNYAGTSAGVHKSHRPDISPDGRHILFTSNADDLSGNDANGFDADAFLNVNIPQSGQVQFSRPVFTADENGGRATVSVSRVGGATEAVTIRYTTLGGTATPGKEFVPDAGTLTFAPGEVLKQFEVEFGDDALDENDETVYLGLSDETGATLFGEPVFAAVLIRDDEAAPLLSVGDASVGEGDSGFSELTFVVSLSEQSGRPVSTTITTQGVSATPFGDFLGGSSNLTFPPGATSALFKVRVLPDTLAEADETLSVILSNAPNAQIVDGEGVGTIVDDDGPSFTKVQLSGGAFNSSETVGRVDVQVTRVGDLSGPSSVSYLTGNSTASNRSDYTAASGTLNFAPDETSKTVSILITDDALVENNEAFTFSLFGPSGCTLGGPSSATVTIVSDDTGPGPNPVDTPSFFVRQHYRDFLGRDPDAGGLAFWTGGIESCGADARCVAFKRTDTSAAFFLSIEFQETGFLVQRMYKAAYGDAVGRATIGGVLTDIPVPVVRLNEFLPDSQSIARDVIVGTPGWPARLENNKVAFTQAFVARARFATAYPTAMTPAAFVDALNTNAGGVLSGAERATLIAELTANNSATGRASVLRKVAEDADLVAIETNKAFVLMQYFGYLRRNPNDSPDANHSGYNFWLGKLNEFGGDFRQAQMVTAFLDSIEYRGRFGN